MSFKTMFDDREKTAEILNIITRKYNCEAIYTHVSFELHPDLNKTISVSFQLTEYEIRTGCLWCKYSETVDTDITTALEIVNELNMLFTNENNESEHPNMRILRGKTPLKIDTDIPLKYENGQYYLNVDKPIPLRYKYLGIIMDIPYNISWVSEIKIIDKLRNNINH